MASTALFARILGAGLGLDSQRLTGMLEEYRLELSQDRYRPAIIETMRRAKKTQARKQQADKDLLAKVDKLTVPDSELPPLPKPKARRRR
ncbi:MAG: hypothetical protein ACRC8U_05580 [Brooklawnia sp.]